MCGSEAINAVRLALQAPFSTAHLKQHAVSRLVLVPCEVNTQDPILHISEFSHEPFLPLPGMTAGKLLKAPVVGRPLCQPMRFWHTDGLVPGTRRSHADSAPPATAGARNQQDRIWTC